ncbi:MULTISPECIES: preprotein translocase subunit SecE [Megasphaera]|uniref:Protein translocase subunit SecE n=1 Tax=Megasphaera hutchinsoni TaxID=1588748 RepID=A0A134CE35_9FIRM|nr:MULTISPECIES: preprotein translocase subunit SecE [Megasphaera]MUP48084.1 preprotein translocase subunit SecE [Veillonellaceae bacterium M2-8]MUP59709.1 preprotein translocase subunit SecE [Veillonellaceae bacterium M2-4]EGS32032.1 preprotein translocase, SecE subunit [Megasphaera sp. UPII 135-E]KXB90468.1 preprotein translocase, SecE subunit [Megasphaera hutchinsoni]PNH21172.1 preprotein translocase subunit SecE [Megasphaera genomosp. type_2]
MASVAKKTAQKNKKKPNNSFFQGVKAEMKRVIWPTRRELINYVIMVVVTTVIVMAVMGISDGVFSRIFNILRLIVG